jgi:hypothetical protein
VSKVVGGSQEEETRALPAVDFSTFLLSLGHSALVHLGDAPGPSGQASPANLPLARQTIDLIALLQEKTKGNLTGEEERMIEQLTYDLQSRYVIASKK